MPYLPLAMQMNNCEAIFGLKGALDSEKIRARGCLVKTVIQSSEKDFSVSQFRGPSLKG